MDKCCKTAALYIASLKGLSLIHQHSHWTARGSSFYGKHLLFEKIYESALENLDLAAEKFIGVFGLECIDYEMQSDFLKKVLDRFSKYEGEPIEMSLMVEKEFLEYSEYAYNCFEEEDRLTLGIDDMIMSIASEREEAVYLLQQSLEGKISLEKDDEEGIEEEEEEQEEEEEEGEEEEEEEEAEEEYQPSPMDVGMLDEFEFGSGLGLDDDLDLDEDEDEDEDNIFNF